MSQNQEIMLTITIAGNQYPVHFGLRGLNSFAKKTGFSFGDIVTAADAANSIEALIALGVHGLNEGARKSGAKTAKTFTEDDLWDAVDEDPGILLQIADAFTVAIKPLINKLDGVVDPNS